MSENCNQQSTALVKQHETQDTHAKSFLNLFYNHNHTVDPTRQFNQIRQYGTMPFAYNCHAQQHSHSTEPNKLLSYCGFLLALIITIFFIFFMVDIRNEHGRQKISLQTQRRQCLKQYEQNQCDNAVDILIQQCKRLRKCYHEEPQVKHTVIFTNVIAAIIRNLVQKLGLICVIVVLIFIAICISMPKYNTYGNASGINKYAKSY